MVKTYSKDLDSKMVVNQPTQKTPCTSVDVFTICRSFSHWERETANGFVCAQGVHGELYPYSDVKLYNYCVT